MIHKYICITHPIVKYLLKNIINLFSQYAVMTLGKVISSTYFINNIQLKNVNFYIDLGIIFENILLFNKHIDYICKME